VVRDRLGAEKVQFSGDFMFSLLGAGSVDVALQCMDYRVVTILLDSGIIDSLAIEVSCSEIYYSDDPFSFVIGWSGGTHRAPIIIQSPNTLRGLRVESDLRRIPIIVDKVNILSLINHELGRE